MVSSLPMSAERAIRSASPILIVGTERSGSNLLRLILNAHSGIAVPHPPHFVRYLAPVADSYGDLVDPAHRRILVHDAITLLRRHIHPWGHEIDEEEVFRQAGPSLFGIVATIYEQYRVAEGKRRWGCKSTFMIHHVGAALAEYPDARFIWLVRDPRDVAASSKSSVFNPFHPYRTAQLWNEQQRIGLTELARRGPGVVHLVRYEELVTDQVPVLERMCEFLGEECEPAMLSHHLSRAARETATLSASWRNTGRPINASSVGRHAGSLSPVERQYVDGVAHEVMARLGYQADTPAPAIPAGRMAVWARDLALRIAVEQRSLRHDRNYWRRLIRDVTVRWLSLKARFRRTFAGRGRTAAAGSARKRGRTGVSIQREAVVDHFVARAPTYDRSSSWCTDGALGDLLLRLAQAEARDHVLDVACGTGLVSRLFAGRVSRLVGVDITAEMAGQAGRYLDELVIAPAEALPFDDGTFDVVVCRQGIQFMTLPDAIAEMARVTRPGGRVVLVNLCAYGEEDREEYFEALRLRNPVRRHFFLPDDLGALLTGVGCDLVPVERYVSVEDVDVWSDNGAITEDDRQAIRQVYHNASPAFRRLHAVRQAEGRIVDHMLFVVAAGRKPCVVGESRHG